MPKTNLNDILINGENFKLNRDFSSVKKCKEHIPGEERIINGMYIQGVCKKCGASYKRPLNSDEKEDYNKMNHLYFKTDY